MATKRGICPYCKHSNIVNSIFLVNPEAQICYCGTNMHQISPKEAIDEYNNAINKLIMKADETLDVVCDPLDAYSEYGDIIEIDDTVEHAYLGRILCLLYMSKVRKSFIQEAHILLDTNIDKKVIKTSSTTFKFFRKIVGVVEEYLAAVKKRLTFRRYFYDTECLGLYFNHVYDALLFEQRIYDLCADKKDKFKEEKIDAFINLLEDKIAEKNRILREYEHQTTEGLTYKCYVDDDKQIVEVIALNKSKVDTKTNRYRMATLDPDNKKLRFIKDEIFKDYTAMIRARKAGVVWCVIFYLLAIAGGYCVYKFIGSDILYQLISIIGTVLFFALGTLFFSLVVAWGAQISKKRRRLAAF